MKGWFDSRNDGGPILYSYSNRTSVTGDAELITVFVVFGTIFLAFLLIFPGIRKEVATRSNNLLALISSCTFVLTSLISFPFASLFFSGSR